MTPAAPVSRLLTSSSTTPFPHRSRTAHHPLAVRTGRPTSAPSTPSRHLRRTRPGSGARSRCSTASTRTASGSSSSTMTSPATPASSPAGTSTCTSRAPGAATSVTVAGTTGPVTDVDLQLHGVDAVCGYDFDMMLVGPQGQKAMVWSDAAGCDTLTGLEITLDDEAAQPLPISTMPASGTYRLADDDSYSYDYDNIPGVSSGAEVGSALSAFDGSSANGPGRCTSCRTRPTPWGTSPAGGGCTSPLPTGRRPARRRRRRPPRRRRTAPLRWSRRAAPGRSRRG